MYTLSQRCLQAFGAFAVVAVIALAGCTDAMVGPQGEETTPYRLEPVTEGTTLQHAHPFDAIDDASVEGRISRRFFVPFPPDSAQAHPGDSTIVITSRIGQRYGDRFPFPDSLAALSGGDSTIVPISRIGQRYGDRFPFPDSLAALSGGDSTIVPISRIGRRYSPIQFPPDSTTASSGSGGTGSSGSGSGGSGSGGS